MHKKMKKKGQSLVEYVALTALVAIVCIGTVRLLGGKVKMRLNQVTKSFDKNVQYGLKTKQNKTTDDDDFINDNED